MSTKAPKYDSFKPSSELASQVKQKVKSKDTSAELLLRRRVWRLGLRYRVHSKNLPGKPDMVFSREKVAVFCDGDFWHGRNWKRLQEQLARRKNPDYWIRKIKYNIERDNLQRKRLSDMGWSVLRLWETDVLKDPDTAARKVFEAVKRLAPVQSYKHEQVTK